MLLESFVLGLCINVGHCNELSNQYFYYNPALESKIDDTSKLYQSKTKNILGDTIMNGLLPVIGLMIKQEATFAFPQNKTVFLRIRVQEIAVSYSYNF